jgi:hypothetical protein
MKKNNDKYLFKAFIIIFFLNIYIIFFFYFRINKCNQKINLEIKADNNTTNGRIFLCTLYNNEAAMAYIQIWRLYNYIDKFIIVISNITHSGHKKNISFNIFEKDIEPFKNKIDIVNFNNICNKKEYPHSDSNWCLEKSQRDYAKIFIEENYNPTEKDLLIVADIDEILTREGIQYIKLHPPKNFYFIKGSVYFPYYYHRLGDWDRSFVVRYNKKMKTLSKYRQMKIKNNNIIKYKNKPKKALVTHCSYCFNNIEEYKNKIKSFAHVNYNKYPYITNDWIFKSHYCRIKIGHASVGIDEQYEGWESLIPNDERLKYLIDRSFIYPLNETSYNKKDLETICNRKYNRTPFELSTKYYY